jgi:hypothetical protein
VKGPVVLAEFQGIGSVSRATTRAFAEELTTALIQRGLRLAERGQVEAALRELHPAPDTPLSPAVVKELGRQTGASILIVGSLTARADRLIAHARGLRADTGEAFFAERVEVRGAGP